MRTVEAALGWVAENIGLNCESDEISALASALIVLDMSGRRSARLSYASELGKARWQASDGAAYRAAAEEAAGGSGRPPVWVAARLLAEAAAPGKPEAAEIVAAIEAALEIDLEVLRANGADEEAVLGCLAQWSEAMVALSALTADMEETAARERAAALHQDVAAMENA